VNAQSESGIDNAGDSEQSDEEAHRRIVGEKQGIGDTG
jgi:hypothetical protein